MAARPLVGRVHELGQLHRVLGDALSSQGSLVLLAGEAGVGKTRLIKEAIHKTEGLRLLRGQITRPGEAPYGPIVAALRAYLRDPGASSIELGALTGHLALLLPELGQPSAESDRSTLFEVIRQAFVAIARRSPAALVLDDLQWTDSTTIELLPELAACIEHEPLAIIAAYRSDEIPRGHPLRRMRADLRRTGRLQEILVEPLGPEETTLLTGQVLGRTPGEALGAALYDRTEGIPFFVEELAAALVENDQLAAGLNGAELSPETLLPIPETIRDAILLRTEVLSTDSMRVVEIASVLGVEFDLDLVEELVDGGEGLTQLIEDGLIVETTPGRASFRHELAREAIYGGLPWPRRRTLHRQVAARLDVRGLSPAIVAEHWLSARDFRRARRSLLASAEASCLVHAYRDAVRAYRRALEIWPDTDNEDARTDALQRLARCAELCGDLPESTRVWQEVVRLHQESGDQLALAEARRQLASVYELQGAWGRATETRQGAAEAFAAINFPAEAASERLAAAEHLENIGSFSALVELAVIAAREADLAQRFDLKALALGFEGQARANLGQIERGIELIRSGLALALNHNLISPAAVNYFQLASTLDQASDYPAARDAYLTAINFCQTHGELMVEQFCLACFTVVLRQTGEWDRAVSICRDVLESTEAPPPARAVASGVLGCIQELQGVRRNTDQLLLDAFVQAQRHAMVTLEIDSAGSLVLAEARAGNPDIALEYCQVVRERWAQTEERHYAISPLRWATSYYAARGAELDARACANALAEIATTTGNSEALAGLAYALAECALLDGDAQQAMAHFSHSLELLGRLELPFIRAQTQVQASVAYAASGQRQAAIELLSSAYQTARKLKARPLAEQAAKKLAELGEMPERRLGRRAARQLRNHGLTPRELEVLRRVSFGRTNREIARELFLSPRTVEMHVSNVLAKLDCRSRAEATHRAHELNLLKDSREGFQEGP